MMNSNNTIINLNFQIKELRSMYFDFVNRYECYGEYLIHNVDETKFLDIDTFQELLTLNRLENNFLVEDIYKNCLFIIKFNNDIFLKHQLQYFNKPLTNFYQNYQYLQIGKNLFSYYDIEDEVQFNDYPHEAVMHLSDIIKKIEILANFIQTYYSNALPSYHDVIIKEAKSIGYSEPILKEKEILKPIDKIKFDENFKFTHLIDKSWFITGINFAKGEIDKHIGLSSKKIAEKIGDTKSEKYILASINNYDSSENYQKNIFNRRHTKAQQIIEYCIINKIPIVNSFFERSGLQRIKN